MVIRHMAHYTAMATTQRTVTFHRGTTVEVPAEALAELELTDGTPLVVVPHEHGLLLRAMTTQEEIDADRAAGIEPKHFDSDEEFDAYLQAEPAADDPG